MKLKTSILALALCLGAVNASAQSIAETGEKFKNALEFLKANNIVDAIPLLEQAVEEAAEITEDDRAVELGENAKKVLSQAYLKQGVTFVKEQKFNEAIAIFTLAEEFADANGIGNLKRKAAYMASAAYMAMGIESFNAKDFNKSLEIFKQGLESNSRSIELKLYTAKSYAELGDLANAAPLFKNIIETAAANSKYENEGNTAKADLSTYFLIAASKAAEEKNLDSVIIITDQILAVDPTNAPSQMLVVQLANNLKKYSVVAQKGENAAAAQTDETLKSEVYFLLGIALQNLENNAAAKNAFAKVVAGDKVAQAKTLNAEIKL